MGAVTLRVADLDAMTAYYRDAVRLAVQSRDAPAGRARPRADADRRAGARPRAAARRPAAGRAVPHGHPVRDRGRPRRRRLRGRRPAPGLVHRQRRPPGQQGVLLHRPRGQRRRALLGPGPDGVELDARPGRDGQPASSTRTPTCATTWTRRPSRPRTSRPATVGHVHLCVGDVASARRFYVDQLGFETTAELGGQALFVSAGRYHHHMAMNTWNSAGAGRRRADARARAGPDRAADDRRPRRARRAARPPPRRRSPTTAGPSASTTRGPTGSRCRSAPPDPRGPWGPDGRTRCAPRPPGCRSQTVVPPLTSPRHSPVSAPRLR